MRIGKVLLLAAVAGALLCASAAAQADEWHRDGGGRDRGHGGWRGGREYEHGHARGYGYGYYAPPPYYYAPPVYFGFGIR